MSALREALDVAENFYDGTDYHFDRLTPDESRSTRRSSSLSWWKPLRFRSLSINRFLTAGAKT